MRVKTFQVNRDGLEELESQMNSFAQQNGSVTDMTITPIYTTITEDSILQGFIGVIIYS